MGGAVRDRVRIRTRRAAGSDDAVEVQFFLYEADGLPDFVQDLDPVDYRKMRWNPFAWRRWVRRTAEDMTGRRVAVPLLPRWALMAVLGVACAAAGSAMTAMLSPTNVASAGSTSLLTHWTREKVVEWALERRSHDDRNLVAIFARSTEERIYEAVAPAVGWATKSEFSESGQVRFAVLEARKFLYSLTVQEIEDAMEGASARDLNKLARYKLIRRGTE